MFIWKTKKWQILSWKEVRSWILPSISVRLKKSYFLYWASIFRFSGCDWERRWKFKRKGVYKLYWGMHDSRLEKESTDYLQEGYLIDAKQQKNIKIVRYNSLLSGFMFNSYQILYCCTSILQKRCFFELLYSCFLLQVEVIF